MGTLASKTQQDLKVCLQKNYFIQRYPIVVNRLTQKQAIVHQIATETAEQAYQIRNDVNLYKHLQCESISNIIEYVPLQSSKICSDQEFHYIIEEDLNGYNLKDEFFARKYYKEKFTDNQITNILKAFLCGVNIYHTKFNRNFNRTIKLDDLAIDQKHSNQLRLIDPLLMHQNQFNDNSSINSSEDQASDLKSHKSFMPEEINLVREAPQRVEVKKTKFNEGKVKLNELFCDIYTIGAIGIQLYCMNLFEKTDKPAILPLEIQKIKNKDLKKIISLMTSQNPQNRVKVYQILKISLQQPLKLEKIFKNGKPNRSSQKYNNNTFSANLMKKDRNLQQNSQQCSKQQSFSFRTALSQNIPQFLAKPIQIIGNHSSVPLSTLPLLVVGNPRKESISNISTDRTIPYQQGPKKSTNSVVKPVIKFNNSSISISNEAVLKIPSSSSPNLKLYQNTNSSSNIKNISHYNSEESNLISQNRATSIYIQDDKKQFQRESDFFSFKKHQDNLSANSHEQQKQEHSLKQTFDKYSHLSLDSLPIKTEDKRTMENQLNSFLEESKPKNSEIKSTINSFDYISQDNLSPINSLETNKITNFETRDNSTQNNTFELYKEIQSYRPNKEVEQILKRLGIGSLLYGSNQGNQNDTENQKQLESTNPKNLEQIKSENKDNFVHKENYDFNINTKTNLSQDKVKEVNQNDNSYNNNEEIYDLQTTPIRPVQRNKYNSTIVEVGDEDSQCSQSSIKNNQNIIDLSNHQYVAEEYQTGSRYEGYKINGERDGHGKFFYQDGGYYEGQWKNNKMDGWGKLFYQGGKLAYQGNWCQDQFHGFGKVYNDNPVVLQCGFDFTNFDFLEDHWEYYEGSLVKDTKQGRGKIKLTNGETFEGDFHNDRIQGFGKFSMKDGSMIEGIWRDSKLIKIISS